MSIEPGLVSVIIPVYNRGDLITECVESVLGQTYPKVEIVIVDDGSADDTRVRVSALQAQFTERMAVLLQPHTGVAAARNRGLQAIRGEYVQFLDSDDLLYPDKLERQVDDLERHAKAVLSYCVTKETDAVKGQSATPARRSGERLTTLYPSLLSGRLWGTLTPLYRRSAVRAAGPFKPLKIYEDWEFESRLGAANGTLVHNERCLAEIRKGVGKHPSSGSINRDNIDDLATVLAEVYANCPEQARLGPHLDHFARSAFFFGRLAFTLDKTETATELLVLANNAARRAVTTTKIKLFELLRHIADPAKLARIVDRVHPG